MSDLVETFVEVKLHNNEDFLKICETLTRIGVASKHEKKLSQSCNLLHKRGQYYLVHFKEMLELDGNQTNFSDEDKERRNKIAALLEQWNLLTVVNKAMIAEQADISKIKVIPYSEKKNWTLVQKYTVGKNKH